MNMNENQEALYYLRIIFAIVLLSVGGALVGLGFHTIYTYGDGSPSMTGHIVEGDAYNFIIIGLRGLGMIVAGGASFISGTVFMLLHHHIQSKMKATKTAQTEVVPCSETTPESLQS